MSPCLSLGILGLFLPGLQGALTLMLGAALLSLASDWAYKRLRALLHRWPNLWTKVQEFRHWAHAKLSPRNGDPAETEGEVDERGDDRG